MTSVAPFSSPICGAKRGRGDSAAEYYSSPVGKRSRNFRVAGRNVSPRKGLSHLQQILQLFPAMDENVINAVIDECQGDLNEALEKLTELSLTSNSSEQCPNAHPAPGPSTSPPPAAPPPAQAASGAGPSGGNADDSAEVGRWAVALTAEITGASTEQDAQQRAFAFLTQCKGHIENREAEKHAPRLNELTHQNALLKKAVAIQHQRASKCAAEHSAQLAQAKKLVEECESRNSALEAANYALNVHLKQLTAQRCATGGPPDVF